MQVRPPDPGQPSEEEARANQIVTFAFLADKMRAAQAAQEPKSHRVDLEENKRKAVTEDEFEYIRDVRRKAEPAKMGFLGHVARWLNLK